MAMLLDGIADRLPGEPKQGRETMKNLFNKATGTAIAIAAAALLSTGTANAQATVIHHDADTEFGFCEIQGTNWGPPGNDGDTLSTDDLHIVISPSGNATFTCFFDAPTGLEPDKTEVRKDFVCNLPPEGAIATNSHSISTPRGRIVLKCSVND
jgi:hypothetical protein